MIHVLAIIHIYTLIVIPLPKGVCKEIEKIFHIFLWSGSSDEVNWSVICVPKEEGGLGVRKISELNDSCMLKLSRQAVSSTCMWAQWFRHGYIKNGSLYFHSNPATGSCFWRKEISLLPHLHHRSRWKFGNGSSVRLSYDTWLDNGQIAGRSPPPDFLDW